MGSITFQLMVITIISKFTGLIREVSFAKFFGTGLVTDIYVVSESITAMAFSFLFMSIQTTFIPMYNKVLTNSGRREADRFTSNLTNTIVLLAAIISAIGFLFMPQIMRLVAAGFQGEKFDQAVLFTRIVLFRILFSALNGAFISYLNNYNNFLTPATTGIIMNVVMIFFSYLTAKTGNLLLLAFGSIFGVAVQYMFFPGALRRTGYRHQFLLQPNAPAIRESLAIAIPAMFSILVNDISIIVDKAIATSIVPNGGASALNYANMIFMMVEGVVIVSIVTASYPGMSRAAQQDDLRPFKRVIHHSLVHGMVLIIPAVVGMMLFSQPIVRLFYERDQFTATSTLMTAGALFWYTPGLIGLLCSQVFIRAFYALHDTKTPLLISAVQVAVDITLNFILSHFFGLNGLAAATATGNLVGAVILGWVLRKKCGRLEFRSLFRSVAKVVAASAIMGFLTLVVFHGLAPARETIRLLLTVLVGALVYLVVILFAQIPEVRRLVNQVYHRLRRHKVRRRN